MADDGINLVKGLIRDSTEAQIEAARAKAQIAGLQQVIGVQGENISFLQGTVISGQETQAKLTQAIQRNVLKSLYNYQLQQKQLIQESIQEAQQEQKGLLIGALAVGAVALLVK